MKRFATILLVMLVLATSLFYVNASSNLVIDVTDSTGKIVTSYVADSSDDENIRRQIQNALDYVRDNANNEILTVTLPTGTYTFSTCLCVYSNTIFDLGNSTIIRAINRSIIKSGRNEVHTGFNGFKNITVKNGTLDGNSLGPVSLLRFAHAYNITLDNIHFTNTLNTNHMLAFAASDTVKITKCTFSDMKTPDVSTNCEAIQIDVLKPKYFDGWYEYDGTPTKNVVISECTFRNVPEGLGSHTAIAYHYFDNIRIINNTFENVEEYAIRATNYRNCVISGNVIKNSGLGIFVSDITSSALGNCFAPLENSEPILDNNIIIDSNIIELANTEKVTYGGYGINLYGLAVTNVTDADGNTYSGDFTLKGITVKNNTIRALYNSKYIDGIRVFGASSDVNIINNNIYFDVASCDDTSVAESIGIKISESESVKIEQNTINGVNKYFANAIRLIDSSDISMSNNTIKKTKVNGIFISNGDNISITDNDIIETGDYAVKLSSVNEGTVTGNNIADNAKIGIYIYRTDANSPQSEKIDVKGNTIKNSGENAIRAVNSSNTLFSKNIIENTTSAGIYISESDNTDITDNTLNKVGDYGIRLRAVNSGTVSGNSLTDMNTYGIHLYSDTKDVDVKNNKIKNTNTAVCVGASHNIGVTGNSISNCSKDVYVNSTSSNVTVENNKTVCNTHTLKQTVNKATISENGSIVSYCTVCGEEVSKSEILRPDTFELSECEYVCDGEQKTPEVTVKDISGVVLKENEDYTVSYQGDRKNPGKHSVVITFKGSYTGTKTLDFSILPGLVSNITATQNTGAVTLTWNKAEGATGYRVFQAINGKWVTVVKSTNKLTATISNLTSGSKYSFAVRAYYNGGKTITWAAKYVTTKTATQPLAPSKVTTTSNASAIKITWIESSAATGYRIFYRTSTKNAWSVLYKSTKSLSYLASGLPAATSYQIAVRPYVNTGTQIIWGAYTAVFVATTPTNPVATVTSPSAGKVTLTWEAVSGATGYQIYYKSGVSGWKLYKTVSKPTTYTFNCKSGTTYSYAVRAYKSLQGVAYRSGYDAVSVTVN